MTTLNEIIKRAMSLMKAHVQYSQNLAVEFSHLIKDYEELVEAPEDIVPDAQEEVDLEAVCAVFEELMGNEPIDVLRALWPLGVDKNVEEAVIEDKSVGSRSIRTKKRITSRKKKIHWTIKKLECSICNKRFCDKSALGKHSKIHMGEKPFECPICSKRFIFKSYLKAHTRVHTGDKPFECSVCNKRFGHRSSLKAHTRIHTGTEKFV